jgi:hypothetical protein
MKNSSKNSAMSHQISYSFITREFVLSFLTLVLFAAFILVFYIFPFFLDVIVALIFGHMPNEKAFIVTAILSAIAIAVLPMAISLYRSTGLAPKVSVSTVSSPFRIFVKTAGFYMTLLVMFFLYSAFPEYANNRYSDFWLAARLLCFLVIPIAPIYIHQVDRIQEKPEDSLFAFGYLVTGAFLFDKTRRLDWPLVHEHIRNWAIKMVFLTLMFIFLTGNVHSLLTKPFTSDMNDFVDVFEKSLLIFFTVDVFFAFIGYVFTSKLLGTQIRSTEPTVLGWVVCLACYPPFNQITFDRYFNYHDKLYWDGWLFAYPPLQIAWGTAILVLTAMWCLTTLSFGLRFSNLTYRGLVSSGPYRFSKHPSYILKIMTWWMISVPFISTSDGPSACTMIAMMLGTMYIYYLRARTEEWHLSNYPEYVEYAMWMEDNGALRHVGKVLPILRYDPNRRSRLKFASEDRA